MLKLIVSQHRQKLTNQQEAIIKNLLLLCTAILLLQSNTIAQAPDTLWIKTFRGISYALGNSVQQTSDGGYIITGQQGHAVCLIKLAPKSPTAIRSYDNQIPSNFNISQNFPNPFNPTTTIKYELPIRSDVTIKIYNVLGKEVKTLINDEQEAGAYEVDFNAFSMASGVYFYQLKAGSFVETKKMILLK